MADNNPNEILDIFKSDWEQVNNINIDKQKELLRLKKQYDLLSKRLEHILKDNKELREVNLILTHENKKKEDEIKTNKDTIKNVSEKLNLLKKNPFMLNTCPICDSGKDISAYMSDYWKKTNKERKKRPNQVMNAMLKHLESENN